MNVRLVLTPDPAEVVRAYFQALRHRDARALSAVLAPGLHDHAGLLAPPRGDAPLHVEALRADGPQVVAQVTPGGGRFTFTVRDGLIREIRAGARAPASRAWTGGHRSAAD